MKTSYEPLNYKDYLLKTKFYEVLDFDKEQVSQLQIEKTVDHIRKPDATNFTPYPIEWDDLIRLHYIVTTRKVTNILEFGLGKSTFVFDHALNQNHAKYFNFVSKNLRRENPFTCDTIDDDKKWFSQISRNPYTTKVNFHFSATVTSTFNDRICTFYEKLPNVCPDLIYIDGPDQFSPKGQVRGISTRKSDRLPMSADILAIEHFLLPGTLVVVDGRTANARFIKANLQRNWSYIYDEQCDQHYFELLESPLGIYNEAQINFCLGEQYYNRLSQYEGSKNGC